MDYLRRLQLERPLLFWVGMAVVFWVAFQLVLLVVGLLIGPFGLPSWAPIVVVLGVLVLIARRQQRERRAVGRHRRGLPAGARPGPE